MVYDPGISVYIGEIRSNKSRQWIPISEKEETNNISILLYLVYRVLRTKYESHNHRRDKGEWEYFW